MVHNFMGRQFQASGLTLGERLWQRIRKVEPTPEDPNPCWPWTGATSVSGRRKVRYGGIAWGSCERLGSGKRHTRTIAPHRLVLILRTGPTEVPIDEGASLEAWLRRAIRYYRGLGLEAAHQCDNSLCCHPGHLAWETHAENLSNQRRREAARVVIDAVEQIDAVELAEEAVA